MKSVDIEVWVAIAFIVLVFSSSLLAVWFTSSQEAKSYNKFCDTPVTTWDALWLELRIDECNNN